MEDPPVAATKDGIVIKTEKMEVDNIYPCIYQGRVFLFYKDENQLLNCYEVEDEKTAEAIKANPDPKHVRSILEEAAKKQQ